MVRSIGWMLCVLFLIGCVSVPIQQGSDFDETKVSQIVKGQTTTEEIVSWFGQPFSKNTLSETQQKWIYSSTQGEVTGGMLSTHARTKTKTLDLLITEGVVVNFAYTERDDVR